MSYSAGTWPLAVALLTAVVPASGAGAPAAPTVPLRNGVRMPLLAAGVYQYNSSTAYESVTAALKAGFRHVDTALDYWNQDGVARAIRDSGLPRGEIFLETKVPGCANPLENTTRNPLTCYKDTKKNLEYDLQQLGMTYVDLVILHFPPFPSFVTRSCNDVSGGCRMARSQWKAMEEFYKAGKAKAIGVSNYCPSCLECLSGSDVFPMVNQVMYHVGMGLDPRGIMSYSNKSGVVVQAYSALGNTPWSKHANPEILHGNVTGAVAKAHNVSSIQVALKWIVQQGIPAVTKSTELVHLQQDMDLWSWMLTPAEVTMLDSFRTKVPFDNPSYACDSMVGGELVV
jgi:diketogulonate reductase-like aldo/keto reductase